MAASKIFVNNIIITIFILFYSSILPLFYLDNVGLILDKIDIASELLSPYMLESAYEYIKNYNYGILFSLSDVKIMLYYLNSILDVPYQYYILLYIIPISFFGFSSLLVFDICNIKLDIFKKVLYLSIVMTSPMIITSLGYGWNYISLVPYSGMILLVYAFNKILLLGFSQKNIIIFILASLLSGILLHYLLFAFFVSLMFVRNYKNFYIYLLICILSILVNSYYILPEIYKNLFVASYYLGLDPIKDAIWTSELQPLYSRFVFIGDVNYYKTYNSFFIILIYAFCVYGLFYVKRTYKLFFFLSMIFIFFSFRYYPFVPNIYYFIIHLPVVGGMFRDPEKINHGLFFILSIGLVFSLERINFKYRNLIFLLLVVFLPLNFLISSKEQITTSGYQLPKSYVEMSNFFKDKKIDNQVLILPFNKWFSRYEWNDFVQITAPLPRILKQNTIHDEMMPSQVLNSEVYKDIIKLQEKLLECREINKILDKNFIDYVVVQNDQYNLKEYKNESDKVVRYNMDKCLNSNLLKVYDNDTFVIYQNTSKKVNIKYYNNKEVLEAFSKSKLSPNKFIIGTNILDINETTGVILPKNFYNIYYYQNGNKKYSSNKLNGFNFFILPKGKYILGEIYSNIVKYSRIASVVLIMVLLCISFSARLKKCKIQQLKIKMKFLMFTRHY